MAAGPSPPPCVVGGPGCPGCWACAGALAHPSAYGLAAMMAAAEEAEGCCGPPGLSFMPVDEAGGRAGASAAPLRTYVGSSDSEGGAAAYQDTGSLVGGAAGAWRAARGQPRCGRGAAAAAEREPAHQAGGGPEMPPAPRDAGWAAGRRSPAAAAQAAVDAAAATAAAAARRMRAPPAAALGAAQPPAGGGSGAAPWYNRALQQLPGACWAGCAC